jgi:hypothetical protein
LLEEIIEAGSYADAKAAVDRAEKPDDVPDTLLCRLAQEIEAEIAMAEYERTKTDE